MGIIKVRSDTFTMGLKVFYNRLKGNLLYRGKFEGNATGVRLVIQGSVSHLLSFTSV